MKLVIIVGTRPEIIRLAVTINKCRSVFETCLVHTGQNYDYELNDVFFKDLNIDPPDLYMKCNTASIGTTIGDVISKSFELLSELRPDALLILGDTNSCLSAYSAKRLKIPIFHLEAGNRCFDPNVPEEINRKIIDHLADVNICYMEHARQNLISENYAPNRVFVIGSPLQEIKKFIMPKLQSSTILQDFMVLPKQFIVFSCHREENTSNPIKFSKIIETLQSICEKYTTWKIIFSVHPRINSKIKEIDHIPNLIVSKPFGLIDYYALQLNSFAVISDSGTLTEESSILGFQGILLRDSTEHPEGVDAGSILIGNVDQKNILQKLDFISRSGNIIENCKDYQSDLFSEKVVRIILGYKDIINTFVWRK